MRSQTEDLNFFRFEAFHDFLMVIESIATCKHLFHSQVHQFKYIYYVSDMRAYRFDLRCLRVLLVQSESIP